MWYSVTDRPDIEYFVLNCNIHHFSNTGETPLATNEIIDMLGFVGNKETSWKILVGEGNISNITKNKAVQLLLQSMKCNTDPLVLNFTATEMMNR